MKYPLLILAVFWLFGLVSSYYLPIPTSIIIVLIVIVVILLLWSVITYSRKTKTWFILLIICLFVSGTVRMELYQSAHKSTFTADMVKDLEDKEIGIRGYFETTPIVDGNLVKFELKPISYLDENNEYEIDKGEKFLVYLYLNEIEEIEVVEKWKTGKGVSLYGNITELYTSKNPGQLDYIKYLARENIFWKINVDNISEIQVSDSSKANTIFNSLRDNISGTIDRLFEKEQAGFIKSILLGDRKDLSNETKDYFSLTGLSHLLAISGLHLSIFAFLIYKCMTKLRITKENSAIITCVFLLFYMILTGASPSVVRATIMTVLLFYGYLFKDKFSALQVLGIAFIVMTFYKPYWVFNIGFQLSFVITFYILWGLPKIYLKLPFPEGRLKKALALVITTQLTSFPLVFYYFHQYSIIAFFTNLLLVPIFSTVIFPLSLIVLISGTIYFDVGYIFAQIMSFLLKYFFCIIEWSAKLSTFHYYGSISTIFWVIVIYSVITWCLIRKNVKNSFISFTIKRRIFYFEKFIIIILVVILLINNLSEWKKCEITVIDVGQGDSIYLNIFNEANILIDCGGNVSFCTEKWQKRKDPFDTGKNIVLPYLRYQGVTDLDFAILTHEDTDHIGGYHYLIDNIEIGTFIVESGFPRTENGEKLYKKIKDKNIKLVYIDETTIINLNNDVDMCFLPVNIVGSETQNDHSFIIVSNIYDTRILFAGDVEEAGEIRILDKYNIEPIDILKVGHHGSKTSTTNLWLETLQPKEAIISVGKNNRYNFPSEVVLQRLYSDEINTYRTDLDGAVMIDIKPYGYKIFTK